MDFDGAIKAHTAWMLRLFAYCKGTSQEKLNPETIQKDNLCDLGKWVYSEGSRYKTDPLFADMVTAHAAFHKAAAAVVLLVQRGQKSEAEKVLTVGDSEFRRLSVQVVGYLRRLQGKYAPAPPVSHH